MYAIRSYYVVLNEVLKDVRVVLRAKTLGDIQRQYKDMNESLMYYI